MCADMFLYPIIEIDNNSVWILFLYTHIFLCNWYYLLMPWTYAPNGWQMIIRSPSWDQFGLYRIHMNWLTGQAIQEKAEDFHSRQLAFGDGPDVLWVMLFLNLTNGYHHDIRSFVLFLFFYFCYLCCFQIDTKGAFAVFVSVFFCISGVSRGDSVPSSS